MVNLLGPEPEDALVKQDLAVNQAQCRSRLHTQLFQGANRSPVWLHCLQHQGQRFTTVNEQTFRRNLERLGLVVGVPGMVAGVKIRSTVELPTVQGLRWLFRRLAISLPMRSLSQMLPLLSSVAPTISCSLSYHHQLLIHTYDIPPAKAGGGWGGVDLSVRACVFPDVQILTRSC
ncbi:hypothetical protein WJX77_008196 [Trebouxia sp. C0004]